MGDMGKQADAKRQRLDERTLGKITSAESEGVIIGHALELLQSLRSDYETKGFFTEGQRDLVRRVEREYEDYPLWRKWAQRLIDLYDEGMLEPSSHTFVLSVVEQLNERHKWSPLQVEQIARLVRDHDHHPHKEPDEQKK